ncbi:hypothetical protein FF011L_49510 [Roseimaritima multifibrata]|uniref:Transposase IS200 like protein n=1 Tax=Roseimaritima multifibrata TaxID=1930274 RepID=A0A517MMN1_9BACT|nr:hypothetical protein [Roseimaritima multifibrata]QDS96143.1 hypothetical protein FF011L_49510 [Roseimaritima multifibrata]
MNKDLLAYFITWTCYGTFLPGDSRGWTKWHKGEMIPRPQLEDWCRDQLSESIVWLDDLQRNAVNSVVCKHCKIRGWMLHEVNCRSNHCHVVVTASLYKGEVVRDQFKSWAKRKLKEDQRSEFGMEGHVREHWWTRRGSVRYVFDEESLDAAIRYTRDAQDIGGSKANF